MIVVNVSVRYPEHLEVWTRSWSSLSWTAVRYGKDPFWDSNNSHQQNTKWRCIKKRAEKPVIIVVIEASFELLLGRNCELSWSWLMDQWNCLRFRAWVCEDNLSDLLQMDGIAELDDRVRNLEADEHYVRHVHNPGARPPGWFKNFS